MPKRVRPRLSFDFDVAIATKRQFADFFLFGHPLVSAIGVAVRDLGRGRRLPVVLISVPKGKFTGKLRKRSPIPAVLPAYDLLGNPLPNCYVATVLVEEGVPTQAACGDFTTTIARRTFNGKFVERTRPIQPGYSTSVTCLTLGGNRVAGSAGTVGARVIDLGARKISLPVPGFPPLEVIVPATPPKREEFFFLTCAHVVAPFVGGTDTHVFQSAIGDYRPTRVGDLERHTFINPSPTTTTLSREKAIALDIRVPAGGGDVTVDVLEVDAAVVRLDPDFFDAAVRSMPITAVIKDLGSRPPIGARAIGRNDVYRRIPVRKSGRTSGVTGAILGAIDSDTFAFANIDAPGGPVGPPVLYRRQLRFRGLPFACPGDSGALVVDNDRAPVALLCLTGEDGNIGYATPIDRVLSAINTPVLCKLVNARPRLFQLATRD